MIRGRERNRMHRSCSQQLADPILAPLRTCHDRNGWRFVGNTTTVHIGGDRCLAVGAPEDENGSVSGVRRRIPPVDHEVASNAMLLQDALCCFAVSNDPATASRGAS